jgi:hypothetical protein
MASLRYHGIKDGLYGNQQSAQFCRYQHTQRANYRQADVPGHIASELLIKENGTGVLSNR